MPNVCEIEDMHVNTFVLRLFPGGIVRRLSWRKFIYSRGIFNPEARSDARFCETLDLRRVKFHVGDGDVLDHSAACSFFSLYTVYYTRYIETHGT